MPTPIDASMRADDHERQNPATENRSLDTVCKDERNRRSFAGRSRRRLGRAARFMLEEG
jgi:hypothetical protein